MQLHNTQDTLPWPVVDAQLRQALSGWHNRGLPFSTIDSLEPQMSCSRSWHPFFTIRTMKRILLSNLIALGAITLTAGCAGATSRGPIELIIKQIDGNPAACLPMEDSRGNQPVPIIAMGVSRSTGPTSTEIYWGVEIPKTSPPLILRRGECITYGQSVDGGTIDTPKKPLIPGVSYAFSLIPAGSGSGPVYAAAFCIKKNGNQTIVIQEGNDENPCR